MHENELQTAGELVRTLSVKLQCVNEQMNVKTPLTQMLKRREPQRRKGKLVLTMNETKRKLHRR